MLDMLVEVDRICKKHGIRYQLFAGTALGAVRHKGFIPWDDDLDIIMQREEYKRFLEVAGAETNNEKYFLQKEFSEHWPMFYSKLRMNGTTCFESCYPKDKEMHQGIFIDIFPCDSLSDNELMRKIQFFASKLVIARSLFNRGYEAQGLKKKLFILLSRMAPVKILHRVVLNKGRKTKCMHTFFAASSKYEKSILARSWVEETEDMAFEEKSFPVSKHYDSLLKRLYGDYMKMPSEDEIKYKVHGVLIDLDTSYTENLSKQADLVFEVH